VQYADQPKEYFPIYAMGTHSGPVRGNFDQLFEDNTYWRRMCGRWLEGIPGEHQFTSQFGQDWWLYENIFKHYGPHYKGVYVDSAAFHPVKESNTYFFDKCLGWEGLCVEPQPANYARFVGRRTCALAPFAVSDRTEVAQFQTFKADWAGSTGVGKVTSAEENPVFLETMRLAPSNATSVIEVTCFTLQALFDHHGLTHIDYLSLDVEGHELKAVESIDFSKTKVDVMSIENSPAGASAASFLVDHRGYRQVKGDVYHTIALVDHILVAPGFAGFPCSAKIQKLDSFRMCSGDKYDSETDQAKRTLYSKCKLSV
jgi:FkbM family methyltransferase